MSILCVKNEKFIKSIAMAASQSATETEKPKQESTGGPASSLTKTWVCCKFFVLKNIKKYYFAEYQRDFLLKSSPNVVK